MSVNNLLINMLPNGVRSIVAELNTKAQVLQRSIQQECNCIELKAECGEISDEQRDIALSLIEDIAMSVSVD